MTEKKVKRLYTCHRCQQPFLRKFNLDRHLQKQKLCHDNGQNTNENFLSTTEKKIISKPKTLYQCNNCGQTFYSNKDLSNHNLTCKTHKNKSYAELSNELNDLKQQFIEFKKKPQIIEQHEHNQILQVMCVGDSDNYLDMLSKEWGIEKALGFIRDCALSRLPGDCKLLENIYFVDREEPLIQYIDKKRTKIEFVDENNEKVVDVKGVQLGRRLANNLQNSYLKGINHLISKNYDNKMDKILGEFDIQSWNQHIYDLSDQTYQKKLIGLLKIPINKHAR